tara:strand:+ start:689 stop:1492 length:804 start_codon:yes stop_codon:yes gene_type:complete
MSFDIEPLSGKCVAVTRPREQSTEFVSLLNAMGARTIEIPTIQFIPPTNRKALDDACNGAQAFDWIVFTSTKGVDAFMERYIALENDVQSLKHVRLCAVGPATAAKLGDYQLVVNAMPKEYHGDAIAELLGKYVRGARVLLPRADLASKNLPGALRRAGAEVHDVIAYRTIPDQSKRHEVSTMLIDKQIDVMTFTSASTVRNFVAMMGDSSVTHLLENTLVATIGPVTADAARSLGLTVTIVPKTYTVSGLVQAIASYFKVSEPTCR